MNKEEILQRTNEGQDILIALIEKSGQQFRGVRAKYFDPTNPNDTRPSCSMYRNSSGKWCLYDFGGAREPMDAFNAWARFHAMRTFPETLESISAWLGGFGGLTFVGSPRSFPAATRISNTDEWQGIYPATATTLPTFTHHIYGVASRTWKYTDAENRTLFYTARYDIGNGEKEIIPWSWCTDGSRQMWRMKGMKYGERPLYNLYELVTRPDAPVILVEGEKKVDAVKKLFPDFVGAAWCGGANAYKGTKFSPLAGRVVYPFADNDDDGRAAMSAISASLILMGARVRSVSAPAHFPKGWDVADNHPETDKPITAEDLFQFVEGGEV